MRTSQLHALAAVVLLTLLVAPAPPAAAATFSNGFSATQVAAIGAPTAVAFTPDGRMLVTTKPGRLFVNPRGAGPHTAALNFASTTPPRVCADFERGMLGVAVDPEFAQNGFIYLYYTFNKFGHTTQECPQRSGNLPVNRVSRFTMSGDTVNAASEIVLVDNIVSTNGNHNAGDLFVGKDGWLYISVGDGGPANQANRRDLLAGKILRVNRATGAPASGNPWSGQRCGDPTPGFVRQDGVDCAEAFSWGLRNPFRMAADPNAAGTRFFINDVGQGTWEEIDEGQSGASYGWPEREGPCAQGSNCAPPFAAPPNNAVNPIFAYNRTQGCASITGGAFVPNDSAWPAEFAGTYLYSDYVCGRIWRLGPGSSGGFAFASTSFGTGLGNSSAVHMLFGPIESGVRPLYYTTFAGGGEVVRVAPPAPTPVNRAPVARVSASPTSTAAQSLGVSFDGGQSSDPDGDPLSYEWVFGDGQTRTTTAATTSYTYSVPSGARSFTASLVVRDDEGLASPPATVRIDLGNTPPTPTISAPPTDFVFAAGQAVTLQGSASDEQEGVLPAQRLSWTVVLQHDTHTHPFLGPVQGASLAFTAPEPEDLAAAETSFLEVRLTATDASGLTTTVARILQPRKVNITLASQPAGMRLVVNGVAVTTPRTLVSWEGYRLRIIAADQRDASGRWHLLQGWSNGATSDQTLATPANGTTLTATFAPGTGITLPLIARQ
jgi:glucose/arabinose dehydrogenase